MVTQKLQQDGKCRHSNTFVLVAALLCLVSTALSASDTYQFNWKYRSQTYVDSTRKDYYDIRFVDNAVDPVVDPKAYDKSFYASVNDLSFSLKFDLSPSQILDFKEDVRYQVYRPEDYRAFSMDSYKYTSLDHFFRMTYGVALGKNDAIQLDYLNNVYQIPIDKLTEYVSNTGKARFNHRINNRTSLGFEGDFEEREYPNDKASNYRETAMIIDFSEFFPERLRYNAVPNSIRGDKSTFEHTPTGMTSKKVVDYYTTWTKSPRDPEPQAKYVTDVARGDLHLSLTGDFRSRERTTIDNSYDQPSGILKASYKAYENLKFLLEETYYSRKYKSESDYYYLYNHDSNRVSLSGTYQPDKTYTHILTVSNELYDHISHKEQNYGINSFIWETYYLSGRNAANIYLRESLTRYGQPRFYYPDSDQFQGVFSWDYTITRDYYLHLKDEWVDADYQNFEDLFYSSYVRNTWKVSFEKYVSKTQSLELGYLNKRETHKTYYSNDIVEKSLFFSWNSNL